MYKIVCKEFKTESFSNGDEKEWEKNIDYVRELSDIYGFGGELKELFHSMLSQGVCYTTEQERADRVEHVLDEEGYRIDSITIE